MRHKACNLYSKLDLIQFSFTAMHACFQYYFHMRGDNIGDLNVTIEDKVGSEIARWSKSGHFGSRWDRGYVSLPANTAVVCTVCNLIYLK